MDTRADMLNRDETGATAVEYALMAALIALVIVVAVGALGFNLNELFNNRILHGALQ
jgi:pilus assembly protein Flp/PilA